MGIKIWVQFFFPTLFHSPSPPWTTYREVKSGVSLTRTNLPLFIDKGVGRDYSKENTKKLNEKVGRTKTTEKLGLEVEII